MFVVVPGATTWTGAAVAGLSMLGRRLACVDSMRMAFRYFERQTKADVGKGQICLAVAEVQLEDGWGWSGQRDQRSLNAGSGEELLCCKGGPN